MPLRVVFAPEAATHLEEIEFYLAKRFYPANARRFVERLTALASRSDTRRTGERRATIYDPASV